MERELPAPVITITDPSRPGEVGDVLISGDEREPWRPSRRHYRALAYVLLLVVAAVVPAQVVSARAQDHRDAVAEADLVKLAVSATSSALTGPDVSLTVTNETDHALRLLSVQVREPGYGVTRVDRTIAAHSAIPVTVPDTRTCGRDQISPANTGTVTTVSRTSHGERVLRSVTVSDQAWQQLTSVARERCGWKTPLEALRVTATWVRSGSDLVLRGTVSNSGKAELAVDAVNPGLLEGNVAGNTTPIRLPAGATRPFSYRIALGGCGDLGNAGPVRADVSATALGPVQSSATLDVEVAHNDVLLAFLEARC